MASKTYTISEVAKLLAVEGKNSSTVRLWSETFADWLSPSARPDKGQLRLYTEDDLRVLAAVRNLRRQHAPYDEIRARLAVGETDEKVDGDSAGETGPASPGDDRRFAGVEELSELLAPLIEAVEPLLRSASEQEQASFRIQAEIARLHASLDALGGRLGSMQSELQALKMAQWAAVPPPVRSQAAETSVGMPGLKAAPVDSGGSSRPLAAAANRADLPTPAVLAPRSEQFRATADGSSQDRAVPAEESLNRYGLRPLPARLDVPALRTLFLCRECGSSTRPLGVTPTSRLVLSCIGCEKRTATPLKEIEKALGLSRSFWARLWGLLVRPFARQKA